MVNLECHVNIVRQLEDKNIVLSITFMLNDMWIERTIIGRFFGDMRIHSQNYAPKKCFRGLSIIQFAFEKNTEKKINK